MTTHLFHLFNSEDMKYINKSLEKIIEDWHLSCLCCRLGLMDIIKYHPICNLLPYFSQYCISNGCYGIFGLQLRQYLIFDEVLMRPSRLIGLMSRHARDTLTYRHGGLSYWEECQQKYSGFKGGENGELRDEATYCLDKMWWYRRLWYWGGTISW